jgi:hypothetical protein
MQGLFYPVTHLIIQRAMVHGHNARVLRVIINNSMIPDLACERVLVNISVVLLLATISITCGSSLRHMPRPTVIFNISGITDSITSFLFNWPAPFYLLRREIVPQQNLCCLFQVANGGGDTPDAQM